MRFRRGLHNIIVITGNEALTTHIQGYPIPICVMNRIAFKQQRGEGPSVTVTTRYATRVPARPAPTKDYFMKVKPFTTNTDHSSPADLVVSVTANSKYGLRPDRSGVSDGDCSARDISPAAADVFLVAGICCFGPH